MLVPVTPTALRERAGVPEADIQKWASILQAIYGGATFLTSPLAGWFTDRTGTRRLPFILCLVSLAAATALLAVGTSIGLWIAGRLLQGVSAGMLWVVCLALLSESLGKASIGRAVGIIGIPMSLGPIIGPLIGGVIYASGGYLSVFAVMFSMLGIDAVLRLVMVEPRVARKWLQNTAEPRESGEPVPENAEMDSGAHASKECEPVDPVLTSTGPADRRKQLPAVFRLLGNRRILIGVTGGFLQSCLNVAFDSTLPLVVNDLFGWDQTGQGLIFITILVPSLLQPVFGAVTDSYLEGRRLLGAGGCLLACPIYILLRFVSQNSLEHKVLLSALLVLIGLAMAISMPAIIAEIGSTVAEIEANNPDAVQGGAVATGWSLVNATYAAGAMVGPLFAGLLRDAAGWETTTWCLGLLSGVTGVFLLLFLGDWIGKVRPRRALLARRQKQQGTSSSS